MIINNNYVCYYHWICRVTTFYSVLGRSENVQSYTHYDTATKEEHSVQVHEIAGTTNNEWMRIHARAISERENHYACSLGC